MGTDYIEKFKKNGFGLFCHYGLYSVYGKGEWALSTGKIGSAEYNALKDVFQARKEWAKGLVSTAKTAGCKYITLTTRHHDGFSLYDTRGLNKFDAPHSACGRDLIAEFVEECVRNEIQPFFYHTLLDWYNKDYKENFAAYLDYLVESVEILCRNYGKVGGFWFDGMWDRPHADWRENRLYGMIRKYQPEAMIINNTGLNALGEVGHTEIDSVTFERGQPFAVNCTDKARAGEVCEGITDHWGYTEEDICIKSAKEIISTLIDCRKNGCNLLLNTGLKGDGKIPEGEKACLQSVGMWIRKNCEAVYDVFPSDIDAENAEMLTDGKFYYAVLRNVPMEWNQNVARHKNSQRVRILTRRRVAEATWLDTGEKIEVDENRSFAVKPFAYGVSLFARVAKICLTDRC